MYIIEYIFIHVHKYIDFQTHTHIYIYIYILSVYIYVCVYICIYSHKRIDICRSMCFSPRLARPYQVTSGAAVPPASPLPRWTVPWRPAPRRSSGSKRLDVTSRASTTSWLMKIEFHRGLVVTFLYTFVTIVDGDWWLEWNSWLWDVTKWSWTCGWWIEGFETTPGYSR